MRFFSLFFQLTRTLFHRHLISLSTFSVFFGRPFHRTFPIYRAVFSVFSNLSMLNRILAISLFKAFCSIRSGANPYLMLAVIFMFWLEISMIRLGVIFNFCICRRATRFLSSLIFCSAAKAFPPLN